MLISPWFTIRFTGLRFSFRTTATSSFLLRSDYSPSPSIFSRHQLFQIFLFFHYSHPHSGSPSNFLLFFFYPIAHPFFHLLFFITSSPRAACLWGCLRIDFWQLQLGHPHPRSTPPHSFLFHFLFYFYSFLHWMHGYVADAWCSMAFTTFTWIITSQPHFAHAPG